MHGGAQVDTRGVIDLLQELRQRQIGDRGTLRNLRREWDILLFTHAATSEVNVAARNEKDYVTLEYASLVYYIRQHSSLLQVADGIDAVVDHFLGGEDEVEVPFDVMPTLRLLLALSGGSSGQTFADENLGQQTLKLLRNKKHSTQIDKDMLDAMSAVPGYSHMQRDLWHEKDMEKFVDLFGALHHTKLHRTDNKLVRFDIRLNLPEIDDNPPDLIPNVLQAKRIPQSRQLRQPKPLEHYLMKGAASVGATGNDCDLLFSSQKTAIQISVPEKGNTNASTVDNTTAAPMKVWENLGPNKIEIAPRLRLGEHSPGSTSASTTLEGGSKELVSEVDLVRFQWSPLQLITNLNHVQQYIDQHSDNLQTTRAAMEKYKKEQLEILADAIYDLKASRPRSETTDMQTNEDARRQLRRFQQQLQRRLLDEQIQETKSQEYRRRAQELLDDEATTRRDRESQLQIEHDKKRLIEIYDGLMADSERRHRKALWKQVRASRKLTAPSSLSNLFHMEIADWRQDSQIRPQTDLNPGQLKHQRAIGAVETDERDLKNQSTIRVLQAPGGNSAENILRDNSIDEAIMPHTSVRVSQEPGGDGQTAESLIYQGEDSDENYLHSNIRLLNVPGGGGTDAFNTIYQGESLIANHINTTRVTQEPGGSGEAAIKAIYNGDLEQANAFGHTRILQEPGASGSSAENAIYRGQDEYRSDVPSVRVLQEPGGSGRSAANIIHQGGDEYVENSHIRIVQEPGGSGETVSNLLYGKALDEQDPFRATIRVTQAPGGDGSELSDTLYASFSKLGVSKSSVKILAPPGGGYDTVSKLVFGGLQEKAKTRLQDQKSNIRLEWKLFQDRTKQRLTYPSIEALQIDSTRLEGDFDQAILAYRALMDSVSTQVIDQRAFVGSVTLSLLREHVHLMSHLGALHDLVLLNGGIWVERFMQEFTAGLDASTRVNWGVPGSLNDLLAAALDEANYNQTESSHLFAFGTTDELELLLANRTLVPPLQEVLRGIEPVYALPKVLEVVIPLPMLRVYTRIHSHLFQLKAIAYSMQSVRHTLRKYNVSSTSCHLMAHIQHHLCTTLVSHCFQEWHRFQKKVSDCNDTIDFKKHHNTFIMSIEHRCFLDPNTEQVHRNIQTCLDRVVHVVEVIQNNSTSASTLNRVLAHLLQNATDQQKEMSDLVQALRDDPSEAADELLRRLDFNDFYSPDQSC
ncbi:hypothetical protein Ae201684P_000133 [Aphanomyces euteiches]|nr:hypothetical protein Ae201684P_000133 [Aphanomyces euteiches]